MEELNPNEIAGKIAANMITELFKQSIGGVNDVKNWLNTKNKKYDFFGIAANRYIKKLESRNRDIRIIGMKKPIPLRKIFVKVNILDGTSSLQSLTIKQLEDLFYVDGKAKFVADVAHSEKISQLKSRQRIESKDEVLRVGNLRKTTPGIDVVNSCDKIFLIGKPGAGKTTFLKHIVLTALDDMLVEKRIPIYISLKDWCDSNKKLFEFVINQFEICDFPDSELFAENILKKGKCIILFDGLDEVVDNNDNVIKELNDFIDKYLNNKYIISCRIAASNYVFEKFTEVEIADFDNVQIKKFIKNWFSDNKTSADDCWAEFIKEANIRLLYMAATPLLLTFMCILFEETYRFPNNRAELYRKAVELLFTKWDAARNIRRGDIYKELSLRYKETLLSRIAFQTFERQQYFFERKTAEHYIQDFIINLINIDKKNIEIDSSVILTAIEAQHGLLVERTKDVYSFMHLTIHEYFAARYLVDNLHKEQIVKVIHNNLLNNRWKEVFIITAGIMHEADKFLLEMQSQLLQKYDEFMLKDFLKSVYTIIKDENYFPIEIRRTLALFHALDLFAIREYAHKSGILFTKLRANILALTNALCLTYVRQEKYTPVKILLESIRYDDIRTFAHEQNRAINFNSDLLKTRGKKLIINELLIDNLNQYVQVNKTLVDCLNADCYITNKTRSSILNNVLI